MIVDGKQIAQEVISELAKERASLAPVVKLGFVLSQGDEASASFVKMKERIADRLHVVVVREEVTTTQEALHAIKRLEKITDGILVQLPLPENVDTEKVISAVPKEKDVDFVHSPVALAIEEVLKRTNTNVENMVAVVVGQGRLVGAPAAELLRRLGARVSVVTAEQGSLEELKNADIVILGAGNPGMVHPEMLKKGVVLIDAGTSESAGKLAGDATAACADVASIYTPVPGGIGPIAVAMIFKNLFMLAKRS
ncbi:bifunctional 5,10-methylenetetrahydrofolate dehydrogenase/5,10-methenyltetrahydrofolate cyclohydrolase [Acetobacteraceae bacterium]|nr:bifunctional 5,10-methylenetetrahydrofolate dehydrogenase/5,10-methenyltetrahydrofolate cyclohydrolase [Candidatus Parcubacteria bacterium]